MADYWIETVEGGQSIHRQAFLDNWMLRAVGEVDGLRVVDLGCGEGRFSRMLSRRGATVTDFSQRFIDYAIANRVGEETYRVADMENMEALGDDSFDLAVSYVTLVDFPNHAAAIGEAYRVLRSGGRFVGCNLQSMTSAGMGWIKHGEEKLHYKLDDYFDETERMMRFRGYDLTNFHRTLSTYINSFIGAGFVVDKLLEPMPTREQVERYPYVADNLRVPEFIIYLLSKS